MVGNPSTSVTKDITNIRVFGDKLKERGLKMAANLCYLIVSYIKEQSDIRPLCAKPKHSTGKDTANQKSLIPVIYEYVCGLHYVPQHMRWQLQTVKPTSDGPSIYDIQIGHSQCLNASSSSFQVLKLLLRPCLLQAFEVRTTIINHCCFFDFQVFEL